MPIKRRKGKQWAASRSATSTSAATSASTTTTTNTATTAARFASGEDGGGGERDDRPDEPTAEEAGDDANNSGALPEANQGGGGGGDDDDDDDATLPKEEQPEEGTANRFEASGSTDARGTSNEDEERPPSPKGMPHSSPSPSPNHRPGQQQDSNLVLTSEKRRGVYECDYCYADISQLPRVRCATCPDFDLCLSCFATADHPQTLRRLKAQASAHQAVGGGDAQPGGSAGDGGGGGTATATATADVTAAMLAGSGVSIAVLGHEASHGYRVCDSTRYPLFPTSRNLSLKGVVQSLEEKLNESAKNNESKDVMILDDDAMDVDEQATPGRTDGANSSADNANDGSEASVGNKAAGERVAPEAPSTGGGGGDEGLASSSSFAGIESFALADDPRSVWTIEEDLRLLDGVKTHGLGNWGDVAEAVSGHGSVGKTPKRCMERYLDDYLGRYGHVLPPYMLLEQEENATATTSRVSNPVALSANSDPIPDEEPGKESTVNPLTTEGVKDRSSTPAIPETTTEIRASKRRSAFLRSPSALAGQSMTARKRFKAVPTELSPAIQRLWANPFVPDGFVMGQDVGREQTYKAEQTFVKMISQLENQEKVEELRKEWAEAKLFKPGGPTVLPMRPEDVVTLPGAELAGYMPRRGDFDIEWDNDAEHIVADMEFLPREPAQDQELKLKVLAIYNSKLEEREKRKRFVLSRKLYDYRSIQVEEQKLPRDERDLIHRMRLFERFHTPAEHKQFLADLLKAKRLRKEIAKLQMYRRMGIRTLAEAEMYELDKSRRSFHKATQQQKAADAAKAAEAAAASSSNSDGIVAPVKMSDESISSSLWRQYRTSDRKVRKSITRGLDSNVQDSNSPMADAEKSVAHPEDATDAKSDDAKPPTGEATSTTPPPDVAQSGGTVPLATQVEQTSPMDIDSSPQQLPLTAPVSEDIAMQESDALPSPEAVDELAALPGYQFLLTREADLCRSLQLTPRQYLDVKRVLLQESLAHGLLDSSTTKRSVAMIDTMRRGNVIDFMVRSGWISPTPSLRTVSGRDPTDMST